MSTKPTREQRLEACLNFFASVIKSEEPWTSICEPKVYDAAMNSRDELIQKLSDAVRDLTVERDMLKAHVARQDHMLDNAATLLETGAAMIGTTQVALDKAEAALTEARIQRDFNAKSIDKLNAELVDAIAQRDQVIRKLHE